MTSIDDDGVTHTVTVDDIGRLTEISYGDGGDITYTWDDFGNLTDRGGTEATTLGIDFSGRSFTDNHESGATYDTMGQVKSDGSTSYRWDALGRVEVKRNATERVEMVYDDAGRVVHEYTLRDGAHLLTTFVYDPLGRVTLRLEGHAGGSTKVAAYYVYAGGLTPVAVVKPVGPKVVYEALHYDMVGTLRLATSGSGEVVETAEKTPFGAERSSSGKHVQSDFTYAGHGDFKAGASNFKARQFGQEMPQFLSPDAVLGSAGSPMSMNRYHYANGNPLAYVDPDGNIPVAPLVFLVAVGGEVVMMNSVPLALLAVGGTSYAIYASSSDTQTGEVVVNYEDARNASAAGADPTPDTDGAGAMKPPGRGADSINWPPNRGFHGPSQKLTLQPGTMIDRYGTDYGTFVSPVGTSYGERALPYEEGTRTYSQFEVVTPITVDAGTTAPWFGQPGMGIQYELPDRVNELLESGALVRVQP